jgi:hypothetical protein
VAGAVDVRVVTVRRLILNVSRRNRDTTGLFFRSSVDLVVRLVLAEVLRDRCRQRRLAMVNVADRADVNVRLMRSNLLFAISALHYLFPPGDDFSLSVNWYSGHF